jgi:hypothetical protein
MALFSSMAAAEARARVLMSTGAAIVAHSERLKDGTIAVRLLRKTSLAGYVGTATRTEAGQNKGGAWDYVTDDTQT